MVGTRVKDNSGVTAGWCKAISRTEDPEEDVLETEDSLIGGVAVKDEDKMTGVLGAPPASDQVGPNRRARILDKGLNCAD